MKQTTTVTPTPQVALRTPDGFFWVATDNGLYRADSHGELQQQPLPSLTHHPFPSIHAMTVDSAGGRLWIGAWNHLYLYDLRRERFITTADSAIHQTTALTCDSLGRVLAKTEHGLYRYTLNDTLPNGLTEQLDAVAYTKAEIPAIDLGGYHFPENSQNYSWLWLVSAALLLMVAAVKVFKNHPRPNLAGREVDSPADENSIENSIDSHLLGRGVGCEASPKPTFLERASKVVDAHIADTDFNADMFAQEMAVSRAQLFRKLKATSGQTVLEFVNERRMTLATVLLTTTDRTVSDIATAVGFSEASNFRRSFLRWVGMTPSDYRKSHAPQNCL